MRGLILALTLSMLVASAEGAGRMGPTDPDELEAFLAGLLPALMESYHVPGAIFVMVKEGEIFFARGYGYADLETRRPVDPETTIFRVASVSKLFTATAAMQLVEQGKLDLHADVNRYLTKLQIESAYGEPVTLHHLLTHTAGFDDRFLRTGLTIGSPLPPLGQYLAERMPPRVMPPGKLISYSNHGLALVGHLVEVASGESFTGREAVSFSLSRSPLIWRLPMNTRMATTSGWVTTTISWVRLPSSTRPAPTLPGS
jgi:CubicO group peptidase (beta-lactamase class C family)